MLPKEIRFKHKTSLWSKLRIGQALGVYADTPVAKDVHVTGFKIDSRLIEPGDCFIAMPGRVCDGHDYIEHAKERGASCVIGQFDADFVVPDCYEAIFTLAEYAREHSMAKHVAVTGSVGKTTTTRFLFQLMDPRHSVVAPRENYNNKLGVALSLLDLLRGDLEIGLFELGTSHPGEIRVLADMVKPDIAIITKIGFAHIGNFTSLRDIALEKAQILYALPDDGVGIVPDDDFLDIYKASGKRLIIMNKEGAEAVHIPPRFNMNIAMAETAVKALGIEDYSLDSLGLSPGRGQHKQVFLNKRMVFIIDDAYNAAFDSVIASLNDFAMLAARKILVIGDMAELGHMSEVCHKKVAAKVQECRLDHIVVLGARMSQALSIPVTPPSKVIPLLRSLVYNGDYILLKGSHESRVWRIAQILNNLKIPEEFLIKR